MQALRFFPNEENKLQLVNLEGDMPSRTNHESATIKHPTDVVVQVYYAGLCGTDLHIIQVWM